MKYKTIAALLLVSFVLYVGCDTDPISDAVDDFTLVVDLEEINTGLSIGVYDYQTNDIIDQDVSIEFDEESADHTVDILSDPVQSDEFEGGFYNVGISNDVTPTPEEPLDITMTVSSQGYRPKTTTVSLADTGLANVDLQLYPEDNLPENFVSTEITAPRDEDGNPQPLDIPFDTTDGSSNLPGSGNFKSKSTLNSSGFNAISFPFFMIDKGSRMVFADGTNIRWEFADGTTFVGNPSEYQILSKVWTTNPLTVEGKLFSVAGLGGAIMDLHEVTSFKAKTDASGSQFKEVVSVSPVNEGDVIHILIATLNPDPEMPNAIDLMDKFAAFMGCNDAGDCAGLYDGQIEDGSLHASMDKLSIAEWFFGLKEHAAEQPALYTIYSNQDDKDEFAQKLIITHTKHTYADYGDFKPLSLEVEGYSQFMKAKIRLNGPSGYDLDGLNMNMLNSGYMRSFKYHDVQTFNKRHYSWGATYTQFKISGNGLNHSEIVDLTDFYGADNHTITIDIPAPPSNTVSASVTANLVCKDREKKVTITAPPLATYKYREKGSSDSFVDGEKIKWDYDEGTQQLKSGSTTLHGIEIGKTYSIRLTIGGKPRKRNSP